MQDSEVEILVGDGEWKGDVFDVAAAWWWSLVAGAVPAPAPLLVVVRDELVVLALGAVVFVPDVG